MSGVWIDEFIRLTDAVGINLPAECHLFDWKVKSLLVLMSAYLSQTVRDSNHVIICTLKPTTAGEHSSTH